MSLRCTVNTESTEYTHFVIPYAIACIAMYPLGVNILYGVLLWRNRAAIRSLKKESTVDEEAKQKLVGDGTMISFLHYPYSGSYFWWEAVDSVCAAPRATFGSPFGDASERV